MKKAFVLLTIFLAMVLSANLAFAGGGGHDDRKNQQTMTTDQKQQQQQQQQQFQGQSQILINAPKDNSVVIYPGMAPNVDLSSVPVDSGKYVANLASSKIIAMYPVITRYGFDNMRRAYLQQEGGEKLWEEINKNIETMPDINNPQPASTEIFPVFDLPPGTSVTYCGSITGFVKKLDLNHPGTRQMVVWRIGIRALPLGGNVMIPAEDFFRLEQKTKGWTIGITFNIGGGFGGLGASGGPGFAYSKKDATMDGLTSTTWFILRIDNPREMIERLKKPPCSPELIRDINQTENDIVDCHTLGEKNFRLHARQMGNYISRAVCAASSDERRMYLEKAALEYERFEGGEEKGSVVKNYRAIKRKTLEIEEMKTRADQDYAGILREIRDVTAANNFANEHGVKDIPVFN